MIRDLIWRVFGWDQADRDREAEAGRRFAATLTAPSNQINPAARWNPELGPPATDLITISRADAAVRPGVHAALDLAMDRAGLTDAERAAVMENLR